MNKTMCKRWALLLLGAAVVSSCSKKDAGPTDEEVVGLASKTAHVGHVVDGVQCGNVPRAAKICPSPSVTVAQARHPTTGYRYWPVKVAVKARCTGWSLTKPGQTSPEPFDRPAPPAPQDAQHRPGRLREVRHSVGRQLGHPGASTSADYHWPLADCRERSSLVFDACGARSLPWMLDRITD